MMLRIFLLFSIFPFLFSPAYSGTSSLLPCEDALQRTSSLRLPNEVALPVVLLGEQHLTLLKKKTDDGRSLYAIFINEQSLKDPKVLAAYQKMIFHLPLKAYFFSEGRKGQGHFYHELDHMAWHIVQKKYSRGRSLSPIRFDEEIEAMKWGLFLSEEKTLLKMIEKFDPQFTLLEKRLAFYLQKAMEGELFPQQQSVDLAKNMRSRFRYHLGEALVAFGTISSFTFFNVEEMTLPLSILARCMALGTCVYAWNELERKGISKVAEGMAQDVENLLLGEENKMLITLPNLMEVKIEQALLKRGFTTANLYEELAQGSYQEPSFE
jgi:hypothetical protein